MPTDDPSPGPPSWLERISCIIIGIIAAGAGGYVAFERSNQLGSAVLLVIGALFLIIGIQGTRLMRFTSGSNIVELEQKKRIIAAAIEKAQEEGNVEKASGIAEGAAIAAPGLGVRSRGLQYELQVSSAIVGMGYLVSPYSTMDRGFDLVITDESGRMILAEVRRYSRTVPRESLEAFLRRASVIRVPVILISYTELTREAQGAVMTSGIEAVRWRGENDNALLAEALRRMFTSIPPIAAGD